MSVTTSPLGQWLATATFSVNIQLLNAAKSLMRGIYTDNGGADYLPTTYTNCNTDLTQYLTHASHETWVNWPAPDNFSWASAPVKSTTKGHSSFAGTVAPGQDKPSAQCWTDCSGFITALLAWVNSRSNSATVFPSWAIGQQIPEAGCFSNDSPIGLGDETYPNSLNFFRLTNQAASMTPPNQFQSIALEDITPGDLVVCASGDATKGDTGHIMLVAAIMPVVFGGSYLVSGKEFPIHTNPGSASIPLLLSVIDQTQDPHGHDSRTDVEHQPVGEGVGPGVGMGLILLYMDHGKIQFRWSPNGDLETGSGGTVVLARALLASTAE